MAEDSSFLMFKCEKLTEMYTWDRERIYQFLSDVVADPSEYGVPEDADLAETRENLLGLSLLEGKDFKKPNPPQHIYRRENPDWKKGQIPEPPGDPPKRLKSTPISKLQVRDHLHVFNRKLPYWSPFDLLGHFLSSLGPAPPGADKYNFFLPMTAVYGRWCSQIAGKRRGGVGVGPLPSMFQCTWLESTAKEIRFYLGSSLGGLIDIPQEGGDWKLVVKHARYQILEKELLAIKAEDWVGDESRWHFNNSPGMEKYGRKGIRFGNCGETYPFVQIFAESNRLSEKSYGLAIEDKFTSHETYEKQLIQGCSRPACANCKELLTAFWGNSNNYIEK